MRIHQFAAEEALASLRVSSAGLSPHEAQQRLREYGPNRIEQRRRSHPAVGLLREFFQFFSIVLWIAAGLCFLLEAAAPGEGMARLGAAIIAVIVVSGSFSYWQEYRAERTLAALLRLLPKRVRVQRGGFVHEVPADELVPGDIVLLSAGDSVPADCRVIEAQAAQASLAALTGESLPQLLEASASAQEEPLQAANLLFAGTTLVAGHVRAAVFATGMATQFGAISALAQASHEGDSPLRHQVAHASRVIMALALAIAAMFSFAGWWAGIPLWTDLLFSIGIIVAMVPEGLLPTLTLALALTSQRMARRNVLIRKLPAVETLGATTVICTDKTGTLTRNRMTVKALFFEEGVVADTARAAGPAFATAHRPFLLAAGLCHDLAQCNHESADRLLGDPTEVALVEFSRKVLGGAVEWPRLQELAFDASRMRLSTVHQSPESAMLYCKGAPETVLPLCTKVWTDGRIETLTEARQLAVARAQAEMAQQGLRVLAFAFRPVPQPLEHIDFEHDLVFCGLAGLEDPPRPEVPEAVRKCRAAGIRVIMVTGDHPGTALAIAREVGLVTSEHPEVVVGQTLRRLSDTQLQLALDAQEIVFARVTPDQKLRIVEALKRKREIVAVTGDGVNDAPALKSAHIGIAMGLSGTDVARAAADVVLLDDNFASIVHGIEEGRAVFDNIRRFLTYILAHNVPELVPYLAHALLPVPLALTPIQILAIDVGTDSVTALGLGVERAEADVMRRPPRPPDERLLDWRVALRAYLFLGVIESVAAMAVFFFVLAQSGWRYGEVLPASSPVYLQATTACFLTIVLMQTANAFACRSTRRSLIETGLGGNPLMLFGLAFGVLVAATVTYVPALNAFFGTAPVPLEVWLLPLPFALALIVLEELRKALARRGRVEGAAACPKFRSQGNDAI